MDPIQGSNAVLSFYGDNGWEPYVCTSSSTLTIDGDTVPIRTVGDGQWKKFEYQTLGFQITLGGVMVFNDENFRSKDVIDNQLAQLSILMRLTFTDDVGGIWTYQGPVIIKTSELSSPVGEVVKASHTFLGSGALVVFEGLIPCATTVDTMVFSNLTLPSGYATCTYTYTGDLYQTMYSVDGGANGFALAGYPLYLFVPIGAHTLTITPICANGFQGTPMTQSFQATGPTTCTSVTTAIAVDLTALTATPTISGPAGYMQWSIDGGAPQQQTIGIISIKNLAPGNHSINIIPLCLISGNYIKGTGATNSFTIPAQPTYGALNYTFVRGLSVIGYVVNFQIYINGVLNVQRTGGWSGSLAVAVGAVVRCVVNFMATSGPTAGASCTLQVVDTNTSTTLFNETVASSPGSLTYQFTATSDTYSITEIATL